MKLPVRALLALLGMVLCGLAQPLWAAQFSVFAAASLAEVLEELGRKYQQQGGAKPQFAWGASSTLARQIIEGARADLFVSADALKVDTLERAGLLRPGTRRTILSNRLVVIAAADDTRPLTALEDLLRVERLALAETQTVPAGIYARASLQSAGLWERLQPSVIPVQNVRAALAAVEAGNVQAAIVYRTDAAISKKVRIAFEVPAERSPTIAYVAAVTNRGSQPEEAARFLDYLRSPQAARVFQKFGFTLPNPE